MWQAGRDGEGLPVTTSTRTALTTAIAAAGLWGAKTLAIGLAGGNDKSPLEGPFYLAGLAAFAVATVALGVALTRGRRVWLRALAGLGTLVSGFAVAAAVDATVGLFQDAGTQRHWVWVEFNLWVIAALTLALALVARRRETASRTQLV
jgi:hypothetical protein